MAFDLLQKYSHHPKHIYRHDLESIFYVMVIFFSRYEFKATQPTSGREERLKKRSHPPLSEWFDPTLSWDRLANEKWVFMMHPVSCDSPLHMRNIMSSSFGGFEEWISDLKDALVDGFWARNLVIRQEQKAQKIGKVPTSFNHETLGGEVQYSTFFDVMKNFEGKALRAPPQSDNVDVTMEL
ncbi:hypothetical protein BDZ89DRAFT_1137783 [Hymenopellis radicata]|nr:hypothetical protein BDZ89DRAFT_1137783 [Hymenopellis radicata]